MAKFIFEMPDDLAAQVEAYRCDKGIKATAEAVRRLLAGGLHMATIYDPRAPVKHLFPVNTPLPPREVRAARIVEKPSPIKSRLKGEWKAP